MMKKEYEFKNRSVILKALYWLLPILTIGAVISDSLVCGINTSFIFSNLFELVFGLQLLHFFRHDNKNRVSFLLGIVIGGALIFETINLSNNVINNNRVYFAGAMVLYYVSVGIEILICLCYYILAITFFILDLPPANRKKVGYIVSGFYIFMCLLFLFQIFILNCVLLVSHPLQAIAYTLQYLNTIAFITLCISVVTMHGTSNYRYEEILDHYRIPNSKNHKKIK